MREIHSVIVKKSFLVCDAARLYECEEGDVLNISTRSFQETGDVGAGFAQTAILDGRVGIHESISLRDGLGLEPPLLALPFPVCVEQVDV